MNERTKILIKLLTTHILFVLVLVFTLFFLSNENFLFLSITESILLILLFAGYWEFFGIRFKWFFFIIMQFFVLILFERMFFSEYGTINIYWNILLVSIQIFLIFILAKILIVIFKKDKDIVEIEFPFRDGLYLVTDGGNSKTSRLMNYHFHSPVHKRKNTNRSMLYATDIVKLSKKRSKFLPTQNSDYAIFNENVYSPIEGEIIKVVNDIDENLPFSGNYPYNTGNTVVIKKDNYYFLLGHLKKGSIVVKEGDQINSNEMIASAGNSGMSERPHIHMQLMKCDTDDYWKGTGIGIQYKSKNLYKNRLIRN